MIDEAFETGENIFPSFDVILGAGVQGATVGVDP